MWLYNNNTFITFCIMKVNDKQEKWEISKLKSIDIWARLL